MDPNYSSPTTRLRQPTKHNVTRRRPLNSAVREADVKENCNPTAGLSNSSEMNVRVAAQGNRMSVPPRTTIGVTAPKARRVPDRPSVSVPPREVPLARSLEVSVTSELAGSQQKFIESLQKQCQTMSDDVQRLRETLRQEESKSKDLTKELIEKDSQIDSVRRDCQERIKLARLEFVSQPPTPSLQSEDASELKSRLEDAMMKIALLEADKNLVEDSVAQDFLVREESEKTIELMEQSLNSTIAERDELLDSYDAIKKDRSQLQESLEKLDQALNNQKAELSLAIKEREAAEKIASEKSVTITALEEERDKAACHLDKLEKAKNDSESRLLQESAETKAKLEIQLEQIKSQVDSLRETENCLRVEMAAAKDDLETSSRLCESLKSSIASQEVAAIALKAEISGLSSKLSATETQRDELSDEMDELRARLDCQLSYISELDIQMRKDEDLRRKLHNTVQELKGNIRVLCRVRPQLDSDRKRTNIFDIDDKTGEIVAKQPKSSSRSGESGSTQTWKFNFDHVFGPESSQHDVFQEISAVAQSALDGYRVCLFAYGQTGSGKTHTMIGDFHHESRNSGMIPLSMRQIFSQSENLQSSGWKFTMKASFLEIYNESINDLLAIPGQSTSPKKYEVKQERDKKQVYVTDLTIEPVASPDEVHGLLSRAMKNRSTASTAMNDRSSRSHSVFQLRISGSNSLSGELLEGQLNLIDLAGSERLNSTQSVGDRLTETKHINKSLSSLGDVIAALANKEKHIPYRNSKLTYVLQDSLGGNCKTLMFVNISPDADSFQESLCSLRFAAKVNRCDISTARRTTKVVL